MAPRLHWLFGDQLGPHFLDPRQGGPDARAPLVMIEARSVLRRRRLHRAKAHLVPSAMRHRAAELGDRVTYVRAETYTDGLEQALGFRPSRRTGPEQPDSENLLTVHHPTSRRALEFVSGLDGVRPLPARGFPVDGADFAAWADRGRGLRWSPSTAGSASGTACS